MINAVFEAGGLDDALGAFQSRINVRLREGLEATCEAIAARARQTTTYKDRTGLLRASTQSAGVEQNGANLEGIVSFAARSKRGFLYGLALNDGTIHIRAKKFIDDAVAAQDGSLIEASLGAAFRDAGFTVSGV